MARSWAATGAWAGGRGEGAVGVVDWIGGYELRWTGLFECACWVFDWGSDWIRVLADVVGSHRLVPAYPHPQIPQTPHKQTTTNTTLAPSRHPTVRNKVVIQAEWSVVLRIEVRQSMRTEAGVVFWDVCPVLACQSGGSRRDGGQSASPLGWANHSPDCHEGDRSAYPEE